MFLRSQRKINPAQVAELEIADRSGLAPKESVGFLARKVGGIENLGFIPEDYSNYLHTKRTIEMKVGDTGGILESIDPKVDVGTRYKTLLRWYSHLAARASMSEQSFDIAMGDGEKTLSKVETALKQLSFEESLNPCDGKNIQVDASEQNVNDEKRVNPKKRR
ncbi:hypothetical protein V6N11_010470 [Hibiscus sabdariffa]|uniref:Uncharacterized protein n=1 Tax=Hibiscus sabdariffa TaxID=183260 RepID=A0ABR2S5E3_9ROSI